MVLLIIALFPWQHLHITSTSINIFVNKNRMMHYFVHFIINKTTFQFADGVFCVFTFLKCKHNKHMHLQVHANSSIHLPTCICDHTPSDHALEGACGKQIQYFSFCLLLLFAAQQLKGRDQPTITVHNGFSASSTSLEACLRLGYPHVRPPHTHTHSPWPQLLPPLMPL